MNNRKVGGCVALASLVLSGASGVAHAGVTRVLVERVEATKHLDGAPDYEIVIGTFEGELDPANPHNRIITDINLTPRNARGRVEYRASFRVARPVNPSKASGLLFYDVPNRGLGSVAADPDGHVRVISGWQGDLDPLTFKKLLSEMRINIDVSAIQTIAVPVAEGVNGRPITGPVTVRLLKRSASERSAPLSRGIGTPVVVPEPVSLDPSHAQLWRESRDGTKVAVAADAWAFADCKTQPFPGTPDSTQLCLRDGFDPDAAYTLVYQAKNPLVLGIGFAATRDLVSFLRSGKPDQFGTPNPAGSRIRWTIGAGNSQSGNFLKSFVNLGFNADEAGLRVFDGINPNIAARQVPMNIRFGVPGGAAGLYEAGSEGTLWWGSYNDRARRLGKSSLLSRCARTDTCPKVIETLGSAEFWGLRLSPGLVGTDARSDIALPGNVRRYYFPSTAHGGSNGKGFLSKGDPVQGTCLLAGNPNPSRYLLRVAQRALIDWVRDGKEPPPSRYPALAKGELVPADARSLGWPAIPGAPSPDGKVNRFLDQDFGKKLRANDLSGQLDRQPPAIRRTLPLLVPKLDADGNEQSGVPSVHLRVPLGTYTGWNVETKGIGAGGGCGFEAGFIPFARTRTERDAAGDPRPSLEERYGDHAGFVAQVRKAVDALLAEGWLQPDDASQIIGDAEVSDVLQPLPPSTRPQG